MNLINKKTIVHLIPYFDGNQGYEEDILSSYQVNEGYKVIIITSIFLPASAGKSLITRICWPPVIKTKGRIVSARHILANRVDKTS